MPRSPWSPSLSGPCSKVETFLRLANIEYEVVETRDMYGSPTGMVPFIVHGEQVIADSRRIIEFLTTEHHVKLDRDLTSLDRATGTALVDMIDYNMNPTFFRLAFIEHPAVATALLSKAFHVPSFVARLFVCSFAGYLQSRLRIAPFGALTRAQYENEFLRDCEAVEQQIGDKPFLFGDEPTSYDCAVYALFVPFINMKSYAEVSEAYMAVAQSPILVEYLHRLTERAFPDLEELLDMTNAARSEVAESSLGEELHAEEHEAEAQEEQEVA
ncbi:hypothetical protein STCU_05508 [Strigomonas culicis]|uniref:Glutathione S-transferase n=1 Tax=Strigomonas culicis TaxID=28005 RepID=S9VWC1_9TRYP|nr:hypothetical protein STCU_05508 [Strigomonas culicis]|eukprot:EPY27830.1 hypothetical protein STCU_05508 [Strigomonas culicis]